MAALHRRSALFLVALMLTILAGPLAAGSAAHPSPTTSRPDAPLSAAPGTGSSPAAGLSTARYSVFLPLVADGSSRQIGPSSQELILAALQADRIDRGTALLYRAYALFADPRLPAAFVGSGSEGEDGALMVEASDPTLPPAAKEALRPFLVRPADPASVFSTKRAPAASLAQPGGSLPCVNGWISAVSKTVKAKIWAQCTSGGDTDPGAEAVIAQGFAYIHKMWGPMTDLMGQPLPDEGTREHGGDPNIDIYIINPLSSVVRGEGSWISEEFSAVAFSSAPCVNQACSGYMLLDRSQIGRPDFYSDMVHEFFHILQKAHNAQIMFKCLNPSGCNKEQWAEYWFAEASAVWAESYFAPETASYKVHTRFTYAFQPNHRSLHQSPARTDPTWKHMYSAYIWPYFMQQIGGPTKIADAWKAMRQATTWTQAIDAIDAQLPFAQYFRIFAQRNFNAPLLPGDPLPVTSRYVSVKPFSNFPDNDRPDDIPYYDLESQPPNSPLQVDVTLAPLAARYYEFSTYNFGMEENPIQQVTFDVSGLKPGAALDVDAFVRINGKWSLRAYSGFGKFQFCMTDPTQQLEEMILVLGNHNKDLNAPISGQLKVTALAAPCSCEEPASVTSWDGQMDFAYNASASSGEDRVTVQRTANVSAHLTELSRGPGGVTFIGELTGTAAMHDAKYDENGLAEEVKASGAPLGPASGADDGAVMKLSLDFATCRYNVSVGAAVLLPGEGGGGPVTVGSFTTAWRPLGELATQLTGGGAFPAHSALYLQQQKGAIDAFHHGNFLLEQFAGEGGMGAASVSWNLAPPPKP